MTQQRNSSVQDFLFVGGNNDGRRISLALGMSSIKLPVLPPRPWALIDASSVPEPFEPEPFEYETYDLNAFSDKHRVFYVYGIAGMPASVILARLIAGYKTNPDTNQQHNVPSHLQMSMVRVLQMAQRLQDVQRQSNEQQAEHWRLRCEQLQAIIQRLQNLQPKQVTPAELQAVNDEVPQSVFIGSPFIAAACRGMLREVGGDG